MPLSAKQRADLQAQIKPLIDQEVRNAAEAAVQDLVKQHARTPEVDYSAKVTGSRGNPSSSRAANNLPEGARTFGRLCLAVSLGQGDRSATREAAETLDVGDHFEKALSAGSATGGGLLLSEDVADGVISVLRGMSIVRRAGPREIEIPVGALRTPRIDVGVSSGYVGEGTAIPAREITTGSVTLLAKKLATLVVLSNELSTFAQNAADVDTIVTEDALQSISETEDTAFLTGTGTANEPLGIVNATDSGNKFNSTGTGPTNVVDDLRTVMNNLSSNDVPLVRPAWLMAPRTANFLRTLFGTNDQFLFRSEIEQGRLLGWPFFVSTHVPVNLDTSGLSNDDESFVVAVDMSEIMVGDVRQVAVDRSSEAAVTLAGENSLTSLFQTDRSAIRVRQWNDIAMRHTVSASVIEQLTWGA